MNLLDDIVEAKKGIDAIFISDLTQGFLLECSKTEKGREPGLIKALRGPDGGGGQAFVYAAVFQALQRQMDLFGGVTGHGNLELSILQFGEIGNNDYKGIIVLYVYHLPGMPVGIAFVNTKHEGDNLPNVVIHARNNIKQILELVKQKYGN